MPLWCPLQRVFFFFWLNFLIISIQFARFAFLGFQQVVALTIFPSKGKGNMNTKQTITAATGQLANPWTPPPLSENKIELPLHGLSFFFSFFLRLFFPILQLPKQSSVSAFVGGVIAVYPPSANRIRLLHTDKSSCHTSLPPGDPGLQIPDSRSPWPDPWSQRHLKSLKTPVRILLRFMLLY